MSNPAPTECGENMTPPNSAKFAEKLQNALFFSLAIMLVQQTLTFYYTLTLLMPYISYIMGKSTVRLIKSLPTSSWCFYINQCSMC